MTQHPAQWYPDPTGRHELRYWDGQQWTHHVSDAGVTGTDPVQTRMERFEQAITVGNEGDPDRIARQVTDTSRRGAGVTGAAFVGGGSLFTEPILVVNQKAKIIELTNQYGVFDANGNRLASVNQVGQSTAKKVARLFTSLDQFLTHKLEITDPAGQVLLRLTRPAKIVKSTVIVSDATDAEIGRIVQQNVFGKIHFSFEVGGERIGGIRGKNWIAWDWNLEDEQGNEIGRVTKTFEGVAKTLFTTADNYVVQIHRQLPQPLSSLVVASALSIDTALKQDARGLG